MNLLAVIRYDDWRRKRSCDGKKKFRKGEAYRVARRAWDEGKPSQRVYRCPFCSWWHVGGTRGFEDRDPNEWRKE